MRTKFRAFCGVVLVGLLAPEPAYAYIDPGLGSMLLQGLAAGVISLLVFWRGLRHRVATFFSRAGQDKHDTDS